MNRWVARFNTETNDDGNRPECPICGKECLTIYRYKKSGDVIGCNECIDDIDSGEWENEQQDNCYYEPEDDYEI